MSSLQPLRSANNFLILEQKYIIFFNVATYSLFFCCVDNILHSRHTIKGTFTFFFGKECRYFYLLVIRRLFSRIKKKKALSSPERSITDTRIVYVDKENIDFIIACCTNGSMGSGWRHCI